MLKLDVVLPGLNEEAGLENTVLTLSAFMREQMQEYQWRIVIADNGSTDATPEIGRRLASERGRVEYLRLEQRGRGRALKHAWSRSDADVVAYMDMDLSTDLAYLPLAGRQRWLNEGHDVASRVAAEERGAGDRTVAEAGVHFPLLQPHLQDYVPDRIPGRTVWFQSGWPQGGGRRYSRSCRTRAGSSTPSS